MGLNWWVFLCGSNKLWNYQYAWTNKKQLFSAVLFKDKCFAVLFFATLAKLVDNVTGPLFKVQRSTFKPVLVSEKLKLLNRANIWRRKNIEWIVAINEKISFCHGSNNAGWKHYYVKILLFVTIVSWQFSTVAFYMWVLLGTMFDLYWNIQGDLFTDPHCSVPKWKNANVLNQSCYF